MIKKIREIIKKIFEKAPFGWCGAAMTLTFAIPQFVQMLITRSVDDVSLLSSVIYAVAMIFWSLEGVKTGSRALSISSAIEFFIMLGVIILKLIYGN